MNKQWKPLIIFGGILVVLLLVWLGSLLLPLLGIGGETGESTTETTALLPPVFEAAKETIAQIDVTNANGSFTLLPEEVKDSEGKVSIIWSVKDKGEYPFSSTTIDSLAAVAFKIYTSKEITANAQAADLDSFGLAEPSAALKVTLKSGEIHEIKFGKELPSGYYDYAMLEGSGRICAVATSTVDRVRQSLLDLLDKKLAVGIESTAVTRVTFERARDAVKIAADVSLVGEAGSGTEYLDFKITEPVKRAGTSEALSKLTTEASALAVVKFVELDPQDLSKYGLDKPQYSFELQSAEKTVVLKIGGKADSDNYFAMSDQLPAVFTIATTSFTTIDMKVIEMLDRFVNLVSIWSVDSIEADIFGTKFVTTISMTKDQRADDEGVTFTLDGENARIFSQTDKSLFSGFYQRLISVMIAGLDPQATPVNQPEATLKFNIRADEENKVAAHTQVVEFTPRDAYTDYVFIDGVYTGFYVDRDAAFTSTRPDNEGILIAYKMMKYAMAHAVDNVFNTEEGYQLN